MLGPVSLSTREGGGVLDRVPAYLIKAFINTIIFGRVLDAQCREWYVSGSESACDCTTRGVEMCW